MGDLLVYIKQYLRYGTTFKVRFGRKLVGNLLTRHSADQSAIYLFTPVATVVTGKLY